MEKTTTEKVAEFFKANFKGTASGEEDTELLGAVAHQVGVTISFMGGPNAPSWAADIVLEGFVELVRRVSTTGKRL